MLQVCLAFLETVASISTFEQYWCWVNKYGEHLSKLLETVQKGSILVSWQRWLQMLSAMATLSLLQEHLSKLLGMVQNVSTLVSWQRWWQICCLLWLLSHRKGTWLRWLLAMACRNHVQSHEELPLWLLSTLVTPFEASCSLLSKSHNTVWEAHNLLQFA